MKKIISAIICAVMLLLILAGCSRNTTEPTNAGTEQMFVHYPFVDYHQYENCYYALDTAEHKTNSRMEAFLSKGEPVESPWAGKLLAEELLVNELRTWSEDYLNYESSLVRYSTEDKVWIFLYLSQTPEFANIEIAVDGTDGSLIAYWYNGDNPPEGLEAGGIPQRASNPGLSEDETNGLRDTN